jgi:hypothetical protein
VAQCAVIDKTTGQILRWTKPPISYHTGKTCDVTNTSSWATFAQVAEAKGGAWDGFGIVLGELRDQALVLIGLDTDTCLDAEGALADWAMPFLAPMGSYCDRSPGGAGIKCMAFIRVADLPAVHKLLDIPEGDRDQARTRTFGERGNGQHAPGVQLFLGKRYFTITGHRWAPAAEDVAVLTLGQIATLAALFGPKTQKAAAAASGSAGARNRDTTEPDEAALRARLEHAFYRHLDLKARWDGGIEGLRDSSRSGRDMSVAAMLIGAGFSQGEVRAALRLFEHGKLPAEEAAGSGDRYFGRLWANSGATSRYDPLNDPNYVKEQEKEADEEARRDDEPAPPGPGPQPEPPPEWPPPDDPMLPTGVRLQDFWAYMPMHKYIFATARDLWP